MSDKKINSAEIDTSKVSELKRVQMVKLLQKKKGKIVRNYLPKSN